MCCCNEELHVRIYIAIDVQLKTLMLINCSPKGVELMINQLMLPSNVLLKRVVTLGLLPDFVLCKKQ